MGKKFLVIIYIYIPVAPSLETVRITDLGSSVMQVLTEKNALLSQELEEYKAQLEAALAAAGEPKETPSGNICFER